MEVIGVGSDPKRRTKAILVWRAVIHVKGGNSAAIRRSLFRVCWKLFRVLV